MNYIKKIISKFFRFICPLLFNSSLYILGMVFVRISRKLRRFFYNEKNEMELELIHFMGNIKMIVDSNSYMGGSIYWTGLHHVNEVLFLNNYLTSEMNFIDIGANQGEFSLFAASKIKKGVILSFEPVQKQRNQLIKNIELNNFKNIIVYDYGLSDTESELPIYTSLEKNQHHGTHEGLSSLYSSSNRNHLEQQVKLKIFDNEHYITLPKVDFIKIDIEGAELFALRGMEKTIKRDLPTILIELSEETFNAAGYRIEDICVFLKAYNYKSFVIKKGILKEENKFNKWGNYIFKVNN